MKRLVTAALLSSGLLLAAGAAPAFADPGYSVQRDGGYRDYDGGRGDGGYRDDDYRGGGSRDYDEVGHRRGHWGGYWRHRRNCFWDRVCFRDRWGFKHCEYQRVCRPRWW